MEKLFFLLLSLCAISVLAGTVDYKLLNGTTDDSDPEPLIWMRTSPTSQPPPVGYATGVGKLHDSSPAPALYWGNTFTIKNIRPQNDSFPISRKRLDPQYHFSIQNQTIAMEGQEYLIRPRGYVSFNDNTRKRAGPPPRAQELPPNDQFQNALLQMNAAQALSVTPDWASFSLTNSSDPNRFTIAFPNSETIDRGAGASFTLWASNPSAMDWMSYGAIGFNVSDPASAAVNNVPAGRVEIEWLVACRWIENGTDCGDDAVEVGDICNLVEFGLCWSRFEAPDYLLAVPSEGGSVEFDSTNHASDANRKGDWAILVAPRPLGLYDPGLENFVISPQPDATDGGELLVTVNPNRDTPSYVVGLPLNDELLGPDDLSEFQPQGSALNGWLRRFLPGKDNEGGSLEITVRAVIEMPDTATFPNRVSRLVTGPTMVPSKLVLTREQPSASFYFTNITLPLGVKEYYVLFQVSETSPSTLTIANTTAAAGDISGIYPNGAYTIPALRIVPQPYDFEFRNFPPGDLLGVIPLPVTPEALLNCSAQSYAYIARLTTSAASVGQDSISLPFNITPLGAVKFWTCPGSGSKRQNTPTQITSFTFTGYSTAVVFYLTTQATPIEGVTLTFATPVLSNSVLLDPVSGLAFAQNGTFQFNVTQNDVHIEVTNDAGTGFDETGGPFVNQDFYMQFKWTPPTRNGFAIAITGLYTEFPSSAFVSNNNTTATFTVAAGATGFLAGPFRAQAPPYLPADEPNFDLVYSISLVSQASGSSDNTWYRIPSALQTVTIARHRFAIINWDESNLDLLATGQKSQPLCVGAAFSGALRSTDIVYLSFVAPEGSWLIVDPVTPVTGALPPNAIVLTGANPTACFTARFDTNWQFLDTAVDRSLDAVSVTPEVVLSGPSAVSFISRGDFSVYLVNLPAFSVAWPTVAWDISASGVGFSEGSYAVGETALLWITIEVPTPRGFAYNLSLPGAGIVAISAGAGVFTPFGTQQHLWQITFHVLPVSDADEDHGGIVEHAWESHLVMTITGSDAVLYTVPAPLTIDLAPRRVGAIAHGDADVVGQIDQSIMFGRVSLQHEVLSGLTVTPYIRTSGESTGISFSPTTFVFTPQGVNSIDFLVTGNLLGTFEFGLRLTGPDEHIFRWTDDTTNDYSISVLPRPAPMLGELPEMIAGERYGPITISFPTPVMAGEDVVLNLDFGSDFDLSQDTFSGSDGPVQYFDVMWTPQGSQGQALTPSPVWVTLSGADAWKYAPVHGTSVNLKPRTWAVVFQPYEAGVDIIEGIRYAGWVLLDDGPAPAGLQLWIFSTTVQFFAPGSTTPLNSAATPYIVSFSPSDPPLKAFEFVVTAPVTDASEETISGDSGIAMPLVTATLDDAFAGNNHFLAEVQSIALPITRRSFVFSWDLTWSEGHGSYPSNLVNSAANVNDALRVFMVNHESPLFTILVTAPPENAVTLTITHPNLVFNGGQSAAVLQFAAGQLTATLSFMPTGLFIAGPFSNGFNFAVSGPDARLYEYSSVLNVLHDIIIVPELGFTPVPPIYTDGSAEDLFVWLIDAIPQGFAYDPDTAFALEIVPSIDSVIVEPSVLHFSPSALVNNRLSQRYSIHHTRPSEFQTSFYYTLNWNLRIGSTTISLVVPQGVSRVMLMRYQVITDFPLKLNFNWQPASINASRAPTAHMTFIPHGPRLDGRTAFGIGYGGAYSAGGRIVFDPPTVVFAPGQTVSHFMVKAIPGSDQNAMYYRIQWEMAGHKDDLFNYLDYRNEQSFGNAGDPEVTAHFVTWHAATCSTVGASVAMIFLAALYLLIM